MQRYKDFSPTPFDSKGAFLSGYGDSEDRQEWFVVPVSRTRDSDALDESNFATSVELLGGESDTVEVHRFGHWGPGWFEIIIVKPGSPSEDIAKEIESHLADYPVLNEDDFSEREYNEAIDSWEYFGAYEFRAALKRIADNCPRVCDLIDDLDTDKLWAVYSDNSDNPYWSDSGGTYFDIDRAANAVGRSGIVSLVRSAQ